MMEIFLCRLPESERSDSGIPLILFISALPSWIGLIQYKWKNSNSTCISLYIQRIIKWFYWSSPVAVAGNCWCASQIYNLTPYKGTCPKASLYNCIHKTSELRRQSRSPTNRFCGLIQSACIHGQYIEPQVALWCVDWSVMCVWIFNRKRLGIEKKSLYKWECK